MKVDKVDNKSGQWKLHCCYCPPEAVFIQHRDKNCLNHISDIKKFPQAPVDVHQEARGLLMTSVGVEVHVDGSTGTLVGDDSGTTGLIPSNEKKRKHNGINPRLERQVIHAQYHYDMKELEAVDKGIALQAQEEDIHMHCSDSGQPSAWSIDDILCTSGL
ncbi:hypothetical protein M422DRAFT_255770 [Sphaerobolus stellatus SS14]|uniref:Uncharacterized protein n=1 Tax=Sphaerobolus stellatus (strain SS14) TaxID=990650 RepID=A0A0C9TK62_SPHS4|nr:hypothetical protein M422DRAFT_277389 [Sphaerobolus stellatus SS14]KIJ41261.1 hypothetical protein M422DRAFT_255770 [Sphaerobolus stellatus SS14]